jgi:TRAP-type C4-dicarboxylate transport system permease large subunit
MGKLLYKPLSLLFGVAGGLLAGVLFKQVWKVVAGDEEVPEATDEKRRWDEVLFAAALQGAVFALVKAAIARGGARGVRKVTGSWPA